MTTDTKFFLPPEIISCITSAVSSKLSLCNLALVSSRFYALVLPVLYEHVELYSYKRSFDKLRPLTVLFLTKPTLAQHVRCFTVRDPFQGFDYDDYDDWDVKTYHKETEVTDVSGVLRDAIYAYSHSPKEFEKWTWYVERGYPDALLALLLPTMARLEKLDIMLRPGYQYFDRMIMRAVTHEKPFDKTPLFQELTSFMHVSSWTPYPDLSHGFGQIISDYTILFQSFPRIQSIFGLMVGDYADDFIENRVKVCPASTGMSSSLTHLELKRSVVKLQTLCTMLKIPKALSTFIYEIPWVCDYMPDDPFSTVDILHALEPQYHSLEYLWLDCLCDDDPSSESEYVHNNAPLLSKFSRLKSLRVSAEILLSFLYPDHNGISLQRNFSGLFPATLETLHIKYGETLILWNDFRGFVIAELNQVPRLRKIYIECNSYTNKPLDWEELQEHARGQGVELISLSTDLKQVRVFRCERGWGMDGSIKWASCGHTNRETMVMVKDWNESWETRYKLGWEANSKDSFYKWHLCHEVEYDPSETVYDEEATDDGEMGDREIDEETMDD
jgi:hypothetical protein